MPTELGCWRLRSSGARCNQNLAKRRGRKEEKEGGGGRGGEGGVDSCDKT